jgi:hypothetical protein
MRKILIGLFMIVGLVSAPIAAAQAASAAPAPVVTSVTPAADTTGSQVVVSGSNLTLPPKLLPTEILFGTAEAVVQSCAPLTGAASSCTVIVPPQCPGTPSRVNVRVIVGTLESAISSGDGFTYTDSGGGSPSPSPSGCASASPSPTPTSSKSPSPKPTATAPSSPAPTPTATSSPPSPSASSPSVAPVPSGAPQTGAGGAASSSNFGYLFVAIAALAGIALTVSAVIRRRRSQ